MKKRLIVFIAVLTVALAGCRTQSAAPTEPTYTIPTLPNFDETLTPRDHLEAAISSLKDRGDFTVQYGSGWKDSLSLSTGGGNAFPELRKLIPNEDFVKDFCGMGMMVVPSNDGTFRYEVTGLTLDEVCQLICGRDLTAEEQSIVSAYSQIDCSVEIGVDEERIFQSLRMDIQLDSSLWTLQILIHP